MESPGIVSSRRNSTMWQYFTDKGGNNATCNICHKDYSYKAGVSNLKKHYLKVHAKFVDKDITDCSDEWSDTSNEDKKTEKLKSPASKLKSTWEYFEVLDSDEFVARCKICDKDVSYDSVAELMEHVRGHDVVVSDDEQVVSQIEYKKVIRKKDRRRSPIWQFMRLLGPGRMAECRICNKQLSFSTTISNLKKHIKRSHPHINIPSEVDDKTKLMISANGQLYEIETSDIEQDPIKTDTLYLEETINGDDDVHDYIKSKTPPKKTRKIEKRKRISKEVFQSNSSDEETPRKITVKKNSLDYFGQYIISLLSELPTHVSDHLQSEIIKQILAAKVTLQAPSYSLTDKPITVTLNNNSSMPEITVTNNSEVVVENIKNME